eukprot:Clim_evm77s134 gene=Clim_evmTU77s134
MVASTTDALAADSKIDGGELLALLFNSENDPLGKYETVLEKEGVQEYAESLMKLPLRQLRNEPRRLEQERQRCLAETQELAFKNYKVFIQAATASNELGKEFGRIDDRASDLLEAVPGAIDQSKVLDRSLRAASEQHDMIGYGLRQNQKVTEILEIPQLLGTCVHSGHHEEALTIISYAQELSAKLPGIAVIETIVRECNSHAKALQSQLLSALKTETKLPQCFRILGHLHRLDMMSDSELRRSFLKMRSQHLDQQLSLAISKGDSMHGGSLDNHSAFIHVVDTWRQQVYAVVSQYQALFGESGQMNESTTATGAKDALNEDAGNYLLADWIAFYVDKLLDHLQRHLKGVHDGTSLSAIYVQMIHAAESLQKIGADFSVEAPLPFENRIKELVTMQVDQAKGDFLRALDSVSFSQDMSSYIGDDKASSDLSITVSKTLVPPIELRRYKVIAKLSNALVSVLNELRTFALITTASYFNKYMSETLRKICEGIHRSYRMRSHTLSESERTAFRNFCRIICVYFVPYVCSMLSAIFSPGNEDDSVRPRAILRWNKSEITAALAPYMPQPIKSAPSVPQSGPVAASTGPPTATQSALPSTERSGPQQPSGAQAQVPGQTTHAINAFAVPQSSSKGADGWNDDF